MKITRKSNLTGKIHTREIDVTRLQLRDWWRGKLIQDAMPNVSPDDREFIMSGITPEEWAKSFPPEDKSGVLSDPVETFETDPKHWSQ